MVRDLIDLIKALGEIFVPIACGWMIWQQNKQGKKQDVQVANQEVMNRQIDGMQTQLISAEKSASIQEGNTQGRAELKKEQKDEEK